MTDNGLQYNDARPCPITEARLNWPDYLDTIRYRYPYTLPPAIPIGPRPVMTIQIGKKTVKVTLVGKQPYFARS